MSMDEFEEQIKNAYISDVLSDPESNINDYLTDTDETIAQTKTTNIFSESDDSEDEVPLLRRKTEHTRSVKFCTA